MVKFSTWEGCEEHARANLEYERYNYFMDHNNARKFAETKKKARIVDPDIDSESDDM